MRLPIFLILLLFTFSSLYADEKITLEKPPASLAKWYKPKNKRNVWHHNMFKLRREIQAVNEYMQAKDQPHTEKWALELVKHYRKISEMVPEWKDELELEAVDKIEVAAKKGNFADLKKSIKTLKSSCKGCHSDYRAQVAAIYRAPDFGKIKVQLDGDKISYLKFMKILMRDVNRIKIYSTDGDKEKAQQALLAVRKGITTLRSSCAECHKTSKAKNYYLGTEIDTLLDELKVSIEKGKTGHKLGEFALKACAYCHGSHRIVYDLKHEID
jgi:cytochrome c556